MFHVEHRKFPVIRKIALQFDRQSDKTGWRPLIFLQFMPFCTVLGVHMPELGGFTVVFPMEMCYNIQYDAKRASSDYAGKADFAATSAL